ncbi:MAG: Fic family protein [Candidatus Methanoperedens sp.]|nr:Fic family protein [Candidatus Methanoperedens sp.]PKL53836.1 MAG: Fic family protein [Candidatus Methanoperedenaceae archaeon HGW-Methanoperedenaceae-1]
MTKTRSHWHPRYTLTPAIARALMDIEAARAVVGQTSLPPAAEAELRRRARIRSTHYSTRIEGNRLTLAEAEQVIERKLAQFHGRERDVSEVKNYWNALLRVEEWAAKKMPLTEGLIQRLHALIETGARAKPTSYRDGQNVIRDSASGAIIYLPPEAKDMPALMAALVEWVHIAEKEGLPIPLIAGLVHYQFVTLHPYYDGNGRTARLLATFILHRGGYGLNGFFSLEEHHARDLEGYYRSLAVHPHHNYYEGRAEADLTPWLEYFAKTLAGVFTAAKDEALRYAKQGAPAEPEELRRLDHRARTVLALFSKTDQINTSQVAVTLGLSERMTRVLLNTWVKDGWLFIANPSNRKRAYGLSVIYRQYIDGLSAMDKK